MKFKAALTLFFFTASVFSPTILLAQDETFDPGEELSAPLEEGDIAPFSGTLLSPSALARLDGDIRYCDRKWTLEIEFQLEKQKAEFQLQLDIKDASIESWKTKYNDLKVISSDQIDFLTEELEKRNKPRLDGLWIGLGVFLGSLLTLGTGYIYSQVLQAN